MSIPKLPHPILVNGLTYIPPPSAKAFEEEFAGILPPGRSIPSSWGSTHYYDFSPSAPASARRVLLIHGGGTSAIGMAPLAKALTEDEVHVVAYDLWGHGNSSTPLQTHSLALMHAQIFELLSHLRWHSAHFLGYSLGGGILASFATVHAHVVESAVIVAGAGLWKGPGRGGESGIWTEDAWEAAGYDVKTIENIVESSDPVVEKGWKERLAKGSVDTPPVWKWERDNHGGHVASVVSTFRYAGVFDRHEAYRKLAEGGVRRIFVLGEKDDLFDVQVMTKDLRELGWKEHDIKVVNGGHGIVRSHVNELVELVRGFWKEA